MASSSGSNKYKPKINNKCKLISVVNHGDYRSTSVCFIIKFITLILINYQSVTIWFTTALKTQQNTKT